MHNRPNAIPQVVDDKYPKVINVDILSLIVTLKPP